MSTATSQATKFRIHTANLPRLRDIQLLFVFKTFFNWRWRESLYLRAVRKSCVYNGLALDPPANRADLQPNLLSGSGDVGVRTGVCGVKTEWGWRDGVSAHMPSKFIWLLTFQSEQFGPALALAVGTKTLQRHSSINRLWNLKCNCIYLFLIKC